MTDKELQKLGRRELLEMLLDQAKESERLGALLKETDEQLRTAQEGYERLRERLDRKDERIHELETELETEREQRQADSGAQREQLEAELEAERSRFETERERFEAGFEERRGQLEAELEAERRRLEDEKAQLEAESARLRAELEARPVWSIHDGTEPGSIAEAALKINEVFEAAQRAADFYLESLHELYPLPEGAELPEPPRAKKAAQHASRTALVPVTASSARPGAQTVVIRAAKPAGRQEAKRQRGAGKGESVLFRGRQHD